MIEHPNAPGNDSRFTAVGALEATLKGRKALLASFEAEMIRISRGIANAQADIGELETAISRLKAHEA
jgi:hypothetical protein